MLKELLQKNWGQLFILSILLKLSLSPSNICLKNIFQLNWNSWLKSYIKHGNKLIILYQVLIVSRDWGKPIRDLTGLIWFFYKKMDSVLKMSLSIEYHAKSDPPLGTLTTNLIWQQKSKTVVQHYPDIYGSWKIKTSHIKSTGQ